MIFYEKKFYGKKARNSLRWWAVESDSMTLVRCVVRKGPQLSLGILKSDHSDAVLCYPNCHDRGDAAIGILIDCRERHPPLAYRPAAISELDPDTTDLPEYILFGKHDGVPEAIMHTVDPQFVAMFRIGHSFSNPRHHFASYRSKVHLPPAGWEYWRTDAYQEFERLSEEYFGKIQEMINADLIDQSRMRFHTLIH